MEHLSPNQDIPPRRDDYAEDEIDLLELWHTLRRNVRLILQASFGAAVLAAGISLLLPNIYRAEVLLAPVESDSKSHVLSAGLGGLISLAGVSPAGVLFSGGSTEENLAVLKSRDFLWKFVQDKQLMPILFEDEWDAAANKWKESDPAKQPGQMDVWRLFNEEGLLDVNQDKKTQLVTVAIEWKDQQAVAEWANDLVARLNRHLAQQAIERSNTNLQYLNEELGRTAVEEMRTTLFDLIAAEQKKAMLANTQKEFAFKVLDPAVTPDKKAKPKRALIVVLTAFVAGFFAVLYAFIREGLARRRERKTG